MSDITELQEKTESLQKVYLWQIIIESTLRGIFSLIVLLLVVFKYKRKELFLWMIPVMLIINNALNIFLCIKFLKQEPDYDTMDIYAAENWIIILQIANGSFIVAHWIFGAQYL